MQITVQVRRHSARYYALLCTHPPTSLARYVLCVRNLNTTGPPSNELVRRTHAPMRLVCTKRAKCAGISKPPHFNVGYINRIFLLCTRHMLGCVTVRLRVDECNAPCLLMIQCAPHPLFSIAFSQRTHTTAAAAGLFMCVCAGSLFVAFVLISCRALNYNVCYANSVERAGKLRNGVLASAHDTSTNENC